MSEAILDAQLAGTWVGPSLKGIMVGNGCTGTQTGICGGYEGNACEGLYFEYKFLAGFSFFDEALKNKVEAECDWYQCRTNTQNISTNGEWAKANYSLSNACIDDLTKAFELVGHVNVYNVMGTCDTNDYCETDYTGLAESSYADIRFMRGQQKQAVSGSFSRGARSGDLGSHKSRIQGLLSRIREGDRNDGHRMLDTRGDDDSFAGVNATQGPEECLGSREPSAYMNRREVVIDTFKARDNGFCWGVCNRVPTWHYNSTRPNLPRDLYPRLIGNMRVVIYNGDVDACVPYTDNAHWTENMGYPILQSWRPWSFEDLEEGFGSQVAGYVVDYDVSAEANDAGNTGQGSFQFMTIKGAGHMVPDTRPAPALEMLRRMLGQEVTELYPAYGPQETCQPTIDSGTEAALLVMLIFFIISLVVTVCLYLRLRELQEKNGSDNSFQSRSEAERDGVDYDTRLDISDRSENSRDVHNPMDNHGSSADADGDELTTIELNILKQEYLND